MTTQLKGARLTLKVLDWPLIDPCVCFFQSANTTRDSGSSMSPPRELGGRTLQVLSPLQADVIPMEEEEEVNMDDEHVRQHTLFIT